MSVDFTNKKLCFRAFSDGQLPASALEALQCAVSEIGSAYPMNWNIDEEFLVATEPATMEHLPIVVYLRCEDEWVDRS